MRRRGQVQDLNSVCFLSPNSDTQPWQEGTTCEHCANRQVVKKNCEQLEFSWFYGKRRGSFADTLSSPSWANGTYQKRPMVSCIYCEDLQSEP